MTQFPPVDPGTFRRNSLLVLALVACFTPFEKKAAGAMIAGELKKWHKVTLTIDGPQASESGTPNPFLDYRMNVTFANGSKTYVVPGYFAADGNAANSGASSGNQWRAHFAPDETGQWTYTVSFRSGSNVAVSDSPTAGSPVAGVDGLSGAFTVTETDKSGRDFRGKGLLQYVGKHHLRFAQTGEYFLKCGTDAPENFLAYQDFDGNFKTDGQNDHLVKDWQPHVQDWNLGDPTWGTGRGKGIIGAVNYLASEGLNAFSFLTMNINGDDRNVFPYTSYSERYRMDVSRLDQWEIVFEHADPLGMYLHFKTQETENELLLDGGNMGTQRTLYYRELIARFSHHLALNWNLGEEINDATTAQKKAWAEYFWNHDPYHHHIVIHNGANHYDLLGPGSKLTGFSLQTNRSDFANVHNQTKNYIDRSVAAGKPWVVACDEPGDASHALVPDSDDANHDNARKNGLWGCIMAGGAGLEWYFGYQHDHSDLTCNDFRSRDRFWDVCRYCLAFFNNYGIPFWDMTNDNSLSSNADSYCLYKPDHTYVVYLKNGGTTNLNLTGATGAFLVKWFDPRNGDPPRDGSVTSVNAGGTVNLGTAPTATSQDWAILVMRAGGTNFPPSVDAGPDLQVMQPSDGGLVATQLEGTVTDDGLPSGTLTIQWSLVSGPGNVTFYESDSAQSRVILDTLGDYVLQLFGSDGEHEITDTVTVTVTPYSASTQYTFDPEEDAFLEDGTRYNTGELKVEAGRRITYMKFVVTGLVGGVQSAILELTENGDPGNGTLRFYRGSHNNWTEENITPVNAPAKAGEIASRSGSVTAGQTIAVDITSLITGNGQFSLVIEMDSGGNDIWFGSKESTRKPVLTVSAEGGDVNFPPVVYAGPDQSISTDVAILHGIVDDDSSTYTIEWRQTSGPDVTLMANPIAPTTSVQFFQKGEYEFELAATDGEFTSRDSVTIWVGGGRTSCGDWWRLY